MGNVEFIDGENRLEAGRTHRPSSGDIVIEFEKPFKHAPVVVTTPQGPLASDVEHVVHVTGEKFVVTSHNTGGEVNWVAVGVREG